MEETKSANKLELLQYMGEIAMCGPDDAQFLVDRLIAAQIFSVASLHACAPSDLEGVLSHILIDRVFRERTSLQNRNGATSAAGLLLEALKSAAHEFEVNLGDVAIDLKTIKADEIESQLLGLSNNDIATISKLTELKLQLPLADSEAASSLENILSQCCQSGTNVRNALSTWSARFDMALQTSEQAHTPWFLPQEENVQLKYGSDSSQKAVPVYRANANLDLIHKNVPVGLEVKTQSGGLGEPSDLDTQLVAQMVTHVCVQLRLLGYLSRSVCIGSTGRASWLAIATRPFDCSDLKCVVRVVKLSSTTSAARLFVALGQQLTLKDFLTIDGSILIKALLYAGIDPGVSRVHALWSESCRIYQVTPGVYCGSGRAACAGVSRHKTAEHIAIKVVLDSEDFKREVRALKCLVPEYQKRKLFHYGLGFFSADSQEKLVKKFFSQPVASLDQFASRSNVWWKFRGGEKKQEQEAEAAAAAAADSPHLPPIAGGAGCILMHHGVKTLSRPLTDKWMDAVSGVSRDLSIAHSLGLCHTDVRCPNVMQFPNGEWLLIDWGLSCLVGEVIAVEKDGARGERAGARVKRLLSQVQKFKSIRTEWQPADDWDMLAHLPFEDWGKKTLD